MDMDVVTKMEMETRVTLTKVNITYTPSSLYVYINTSMADQGSNDMNRW